MTKSPARRSRPTPGQPTFTCAVPQALTLLEEWCLMGGHWRIKTHEIRGRVIDEMILIACTEGDGWLDLGGQTFPVEAGDVFYCPASVSHGYGCGKLGWGIFWIHYCGRRAEALSRAAGFSLQTPVRPVGRHPRVREAFTTLIDGLAGGGEDSSWVAASHLHALLLVLIREQSHPTGTHRLAGLVHEGCEDLNELVEASGYSRFHFCRLFKKETGETPWQYVLERRLGRARALLLGTSLSVKEIAFRLGFRNADYFARLFSRHAGVTPGNYRGRER